MISKLIEIHFFKGKGITEYILILLFIIPFISFLTKYGFQVVSNQAVQAKALAYDEPGCINVREANESILSDLGYYYDERVDRFRHKRTGRFVRAELLNRQICF